MPEDPLFPGQGLALKPALFRDAAQTIEQQRRFKTIRTQRTCQASQVREVIEVDLDGQAAGVLSSEPAHKLLEICVSLPADIFQAVPVLSMEANQVAAAPMVWPKSQALSLQQAEGLIHVSRIQIRTVATHNHDLLVAQTS